MLATLALSVAIARILGDSAFGEYVSVWALVMILTTIGHMGTDSIVVREIAKDTTRARDLVSNAITMRLCLSLLAYGGAVAVAALMKPGHSFVGYVSIAGLILLVSWHSLLATYFEATLRIGTHTLITTGCIYLTLLFTLLVLFLKPSLGCVLWAAVLANSLILIVAYMLLPRHVQPRLGRSFNTMKNILSASWPLGGNMFLILIGGRLAHLILLKTKGPLAAGDYGAAVRISESLTIIPQAFMLSVFPVMSFCRSNEPARFEDIYRKSLKYMSEIALFLALLLAFYSERVLKLLYGQDFVEAAAALGILAWLMFFVFIGNVNSSAAIAEDRQKSFLGVGMLTVGPYVVLNFVLIQRYNLVGAALALLLQQVVFYVTLLTIPSTRKYTIASATSAFKPIVAIGCAALFLYKVEIPLAPLAAFVIYLSLLCITGSINKEDRDLLLKMLR